MKIQGRFLVSPEVIKGGKKMDIVVVNDDRKDQITKEAFVLVSIAASLFFGWPHQCVFKESRWELHRPGGWRGPDSAMLCIPSITVRIL